MIVRKVVLGEGVQLAEALKTLWVLRRRDNRKRGRC